MDWSLSFILVLPGGKEMVFAVFLAKKQGQLAATQPLCASRFSPESLTSESHWLTE